MLPGLPLNFCILEVIKAGWYSEGLPMRLYSTVYIIIFAVNKFHKLVCLVKFTCAMHVCTWWTHHVLPQAAKIKTTKICVSIWKFTLISCHL